MFPYYVSSKFMIFLRIPFLNKYLSRIERRNIRLYTKGYEKTKKTLGLDFLEKLFVDLSKSNIRCAPNSQKFLYKTNFNLDYSLRQFVISRLLACNKYSFQKVLFKAIEDDKPITYSLPLEYINKLEKKNFKVNKFKSLTLWRILIIIEFFKGIQEAINYILRNIFNKIKKSNIQKVDAYFMGLYLDKLPSKFQRISNCQCFNYFGKKFYRQKNILLAHSINIKKRKLEHNVKLEFQRYPFGYLSSWLKILELIYFLFIQIINLPINIFSNKLVSTLLLRELFFAKVCSLQKKKFLAKAYLFDNSFTFRPFWTFIAEKKSSEIIFYFYTTSTGYFENKNGETSSISFRLRNLNWPNYVFWNKYQEKIYKKILEKPFSISLSGPICLHNKEIDKNFKLPKRTISVFDISPARDSLFKSMANPCEYYTVRNCLSFLKDILYICKKYNITLCFKSKQSLSKFPYHPIYVKFLESIYKNDNVLIIPYETSPYDLIKKTDISVAIPFTSTPLISKVLKKPSCYYDSSGFINKNDKGAQGLEIIIGLDKLESWVQKQMNC